MLRLTNFGALAQLGERLHGMQEVEGSNPLGSINPHLLVCKRFQFHPKTKLSRGGDLYSRACRHLVSDIP